MVDTKKNECIMNTTVADTHIFTFTNGQTDISRFLDGNITNISIDNIRNKTVVYINIKHSDRDKDIIHDTVLYINPNELIMLKNAIETYIKNGGSNNE